VSIRIEQIDAKGALNRTGGFLASGSDGFTHSFNPAIGCPYARGACGAFCYARPFAEHLGGAGTWGSRVLIKRNAAQLLERDLARATRRDPEHPLHVSRLAVFSASTTDPCAPPLLGLYRECLRVIARYPVRRWLIQTRSPAVLDLEREIVELGARAVVSFTLETDDERLWSALPRGSPPIAARRRAFERLSSWPVRRHLAVAPSLPARDPAGFAGWIAAHATDATVDTFVCGDGSGGARTGRSPIPDLLAALDIDWRDDRQARDLYERLRALMGNRAGWSAAGFLRLC
jgi:DNA repair photolyase